jgi:hypothetical protein
VSFADGGSTVVRQTTANWTLGAANGFVIGSGNLNLHLEGTSLGTITNVNDLRITLAAGAASGSPGTNGGSNSNPAVRRTGLTSVANTFYVGSVNVTTDPLPVDFLSFNAQPNDNVIDVIWSTAAEFNSDYFMVQHSQDGVSFEDVTLVESAGNSSTVKNYSAVDPDPFPGISYYRLKQVDNDGKFAYSNLVAVNFDEENIFTVYPSPSSGDFNLSFHGVKGNNVMISLTDVLGKEFYSNEVIPDNDLLIQPIHLSGSPENYLPVFTLFLRRARITIL